MNSETSNWSSPPASLSLQLDEVHVWRLALDRPIDDFLPLLQPDELARANCFRFDIHRNRFVVARGFLRLLLARYLQSDPKQLQFSYGEFGKPALDGEFRESTLRFNMSHSHDLALYAVTEGRRIGVDVEYMRADFAGDDIARRFFSPFEVEVLFGVPDEERVAAFFRCWTRKEAYIKATGRGMSQPLDAFDVTFAAAAKAALLRNEDGSHARWALADVAVGPDYAGAVAVERPVGKIRYWEANDRD